MRRRSLLATLGAGFSLLSGCGGNADSPTANTATGTPSPTETETATPTATAGEPSEVVQFEDGDGWLPPGSLLTTETLPRTYALSTVRYETEDGGEVRLKFDRTATADHPAKLVTSLQNRDRFRETFRLDWTVPFGRGSSEQPHAHGERRTTGGVTHADSLLFVPTANHDLVDEPPAVKLADDGTWRLAEEPTRWEPEEVVLDGGEAVRGEYALVGHPEGTGRPPGVYEFVRGSSDALKLTVWDSERPGPDGESRFAGESVPRLASEDGPEVAWFHEAGPTTPTFVRPSTERAELPAGVTFRFINHSRTSQRCGHWSLYKRHGGEWFRLGPYVQNAVCYVEAPGGTDSLSLDCYNGEGIDGHQYGDQWTYDFLGGGTYAAVVGFGAETGRSGALVELVGDPVDIVPTADATAEHDGDEVTATTAAWNDAAGEDHREQVRLRLTRTETAGKSLVREQVMRDRYRGLRNTLAFLADDVTAVTLRTDDSVADRVTGYDSDRAAYRVDGQPYELAVVSRA